MTLNEKIIAARTLWDHNVAEYCGDIINDTANYYADNYDEYCRIYDALIEYCR